MIELPLTSSAKKLSDNPFVIQSTVELLFVVVMKAVKLTVTFRLDC